jgi:hypothetical protein
MCILPFVACERLGKMFRQQQSIVRGVVLYAVRVASKQSMLLVLPGTINGIFKDWIIAMF